MRQVSPLNSASIQGNAPIVAAKAGAHERGERIDQRNDLHRPLNDERRVDIVLMLSRRRVAENGRAGLDEQAALAFLSKPCLRFPSVDREPGLAQQRVQRQGEPPREPCKETGPRPGCDQQAVRAKAAHCYPPGPDRAEAVAVRDEPITHVNRFGLRPGDEEVEQSPWPCSPHRLTQGRTGRTVSPRRRNSKALPSSPIKGLSSLARKPTARMQGLTAASPSSSASRWRQLGANTLPASIWREAATSPLD